MEKRNANKGFAEKHEENTKGTCGTGLREKILRVLKPLIYSLFKIRQNFDTLKDLKQILNKWV
jgi:hypothetical protein